MGVGAWAWGDRFMWSFGHSHNEKDVQAAFKATLDAGINLIDTAEVYGMGRSERLLAKLIQPQRGSLVIASKFMPFPWRLSKKSLLRALRGSLSRLELDYLDLYQIHFPLPPLSVEKWADAMADAVELGLIKTIGVSNYDENQMRRTHTALAQRGIGLASNQVEYSLLDRKIELTGLLKACQELGVTLSAYSPIAKGMLTGKYSPENPPPGPRSRLYNQGYLKRIQPLIREMRKIGDQHGGKSASQVALNWLICKGTVPIPGAKNARQAEENAGALGWQLTPAQMDTLDRLSLEI
jgi:aryl-alcohol dehydrogenase-like predicted oxidoreductase